MRDEQTDRSFVNNLLLSTYRFFTLFYNTIYSITIVYISNMSILFGCTVKHTFKNVWLELYLDLFKNYLLTCANRVNLTFFSENINFNGVYIYVDYSSAPFYIKKFSHTKFKRNIHTLPINQYIFRLEYYVCYVLCVADCTIEI